jgi:hypothetical protein
MAKICPSDEVFQICYESRVTMLHPKISFITPRLSKEQAIEFISVIGSGRLVEILENDMVLNPEKTVEFLQEAETLGTKISINPV